MLEPAALPWTGTMKGLIVALRVTPKAARAGIEGLGSDSEGRPFLKVKVSVAPEDGKANAAVCKLLAKTWRLPKSAFEVVSGATAREKRVLIHGDAAALAVTLTAWLQQECPPP